jgi:hypothetical protein
MNILVLGIGKENFNYKKIEGFYNAFSRIGDTEWVETIFQCKRKKYDIIFGELSLDTLINNIEYYKTIDVKYHIIWGTFDPKKLKKLSENRKDVQFINACKSNIFDKNIIQNYISKYGPYYQMSGEEGLNIETFNSDPTENLKYCYLPCSLSEKPSDFFDEKPIDVCYFGTSYNRPNVTQSLNHLSKKYNVVTNLRDLTGIIGPETCFNYYKKSKVVLSESCHPVLLEYPVRLGESTANGCRLFLLEDIPLKTNNLLIPDHTYTSNYEDYLHKIENYLDNFTLNHSYDLYKNFESTYDNAVSYLMSLF